MNNKPFVPIRLSEEEREEREQWKKIQNDFVKVSMDLGQIEKGMNRRKIFWEVVHNLKSLVVFLFTLPVLPFIQIILAIRGKLEI